jgi:transcriptional regulator with XRE-family HTH domain
MTTETLNALPGQGTTKVVVKTRERRECAECGEPAQFRISYLLAGTRSNKASSAYGRDDISWCSDDETFVCRDHREDRVCNPPSGYVWGGTFTACERFAPMFLEWVETEDGSVEELQARSRTLEVIEVVMRESAAWRDGLSLSEAVAALIDADKDWRREVRQALGILVTHGEEEVALRRLVSEFNDRVRDRDTTEINISREQGDHLRWARKAKGLTLGDAAREMGWSASELSDAERGKATVLRREFEKLIEVVGLDPDNPPPKPEMRTVASLGECLDCPSARDHYADDVRQATEQPATPEPVGEMSDYYFTFGCGQAHEGCYTIIQASNSGEARLEMNRRYGEKWAFQYNSAEAAGVEKWGLKKIS